jgi:hypothetical protein
MIRGLVSQIDPKKELKFWTTLIIVLLKEQSTVYIHWKIAPTVLIIHKEIKDSIKISKSKLTLTLIDLGCTYIKKIGDNRRVLYNQMSIINYRCNYLRKIKSFREAGYDIVHLDETWVNQNHCTDYMWLPNDGSDDPKIPSGKGKGKGKRLIVFHAEVSKVRA